MLCKFGSHLYGTNTPNSDVDLKGVFMPTKEQILLGNIPKSISFNSNPGHDKNGAGDIDCELYTLHYFMKLLCKGEMIALDCIHAPLDNLIVNSDIWTEIHNMRQTFYTQEMKAFMGYCLKQCSKYSCKGSRLNSAEILLKCLNDFDGESKLSSVWDILPIDDNMFHISKNEKIKMFNFCGKYLQETMKVKYAKEIILKFIEKRIIYIY